MDNNPVKTTQSPWHGHGTPCHLDPFCVAQPWHETHNPLKTNDVFYLMTFRLSKGNIMQLKQSLRAVCSELRDVSTKMRTKGPSFLIPFINGSQAQAGIPAYAMRAIPPFKVVLTSMVLVAPIGAVDFTARRITHVSASKTPMR